MSIPYIKGVVAKQAHVGIPDGTVEEEIGRNGFFGRYAHLYRTHSPLNWTRIEGPLKPQAFDLRRMKFHPDTTTRHTFLSNSDVAISFARVDHPMEFFYRNADGDEVLFVHEGAGRIETDYGPLQYSKGDYLLLPRGTVYRLAPTEKSSFLIVESFSEVNFPDRGMLGQHALFDPAMIRVPTPENENSTISNRREYELRIKHRDQFTKVFYPFCPLDTVGWKGTMSVMQLNVADIRPVLSDRYHLPPSAHSTFVANNFVICTFLPRPLENGDDKALKVPFYHSNIDFDEVIFYHEGEFFSRSGIEEGMVTFHPQGIHHGPHRKAIERSVDKKRTNEIAVMIDTRNSLDVHDIHEIELKDYWKSWQENEGK